MLQALPECERAVLELVSVDGLTVAEAAYYLGFTDPAYFSRFFTKAMGQSPRMYRERPKSN